MCQACKSFVPFQFNLWKNLHEKYTLIKAKRNYTSPISSLPGCLHFMEFLTLFSSCLSEGKQLSYYAALQDAFSRNNCNHVENMNTMFRKAVLSCPFPGDIFLCSGCALFVPLILSILCNSGHVTVFGV